MRGIEGFGWEVVEGGGHLDVESVRGEVSVCARGDPIERRGRDELGLGDHEEGGRDAVGRVRDDGGRC